MQGGTDTKIKQEKTDTPRLRQPRLTQTEDKTWRKGTEWEYTKGICNLPLTKCKDNWTVTIRS